MALKAGNANTTNNPVAAADYSPLLERNGFTTVGQQGYTPQLGDTVVFNRLPQAPGGAIQYGHIQGFTSLGWVSDFRQSNFFANRQYEAASSYTVYRPPTSEASCGCN